MNQVKIHHKKMPTGIGTAHSSPPILHSIWRTIFVATDKFFLASVLCSTIWLGTETAQKPLPTPCPQEAFNATAFQSSDLT